MSAADTQPTDQHGNCLMHARLGWDLWQDLLLHFRPLRVKTRGTQNLPVRRPVFRSTGTLAAAPAHLGGLGSRQIDERNSTYLDPSWPFTSLTSSGVKVKDASLVA